MNMKALGDSGRVVDIGQIFAQCPQEIRVVLPVIVPQHENIGVVKLLQCVTFVEYAGNVQDAVVAIAVEGAILGEKLPHLV